jgi:hypothetical protein
VVFGRAVLRIVPRRGSIVYFTVCESPLAKQQNQGKTTMSDNKLNGFTSLRTIKVCTQYLLAPPAKVFPLLCPTREYDWIERWKCQMIHSESGIAEQDCIFTTDFPNGQKDTWVVSVYRSNEEIQFVRFNGLRVIRYSITLTDRGDGTTTAEWKQIITDLNVEGNRLVESLTDDAYRQQILGLERELNHYLTTGEMLRDIS